MTPWHTAPVFSIYRQRVCDSMIHKNVLGYGLLQPGEAKVEFLEGLLDKRAHDSALRYDPGTPPFYPGMPLQSHSAPNSCLQILETLGNYQKRICQDPGSRFDQNSKCWQHFSSLRGKSLSSDLTGDYGVYLWMRRETQKFSTRR